MTRRKLAPEELESAYALARIISDRVAQDGHSWLAVVGGPVPRVAQCSTLTSAIAAVLGDLMIGGWTIPSGWEP